MKLWKIAALCLLSAPAFAQVQLGRNVQIGGAGTSGCGTTGITPGDLLFPDNSGNCVGSDNMQASGPVGGVNGADTLTIKTPTSQPGDDFNLELFSAVDAIHNDSFFGPHLWEMDCTNSGTTTLGCGILLNVTDIGRPSGASGGLNPVYIKMRAEQGGDHPSYVGMEIEQHSDDGLDQSTNNYVGFNIDGFSQGIDTTWNAVRGFAYQPNFAHIIAATDFSGFGVFSHGGQTLPSNYCDFRAQDTSGSPIVRGKLFCGPTFASTFNGPVGVNDGTGSAGLVAIKQGTAASTVANSIGISAPSSVTAYNFKLPGAQGTGALTNDGAGNLSWTAAGGTPGGSNTQVQFNDSGAFGGDAGFTWNKATKVLGLPTTTRIEAGENPDSFAKYNFNSYPTTPLDPTGTNLLEAFYLPNYSVDEIGHDNALAFFIGPAAGSTHNFGHMAGIIGNAGHSGTGTVNELVGANFFSGNHSTGTVSNLHALHIGLSNDGGGTVTDAYGMQIDAPFGSGFPATTDGIRILAQTRYNIYSEGSSSANLFEGSVTAANLTDTALTAGNCVQASTGGLLTTTGSACGSSGGGGLSGQTVNYLPKANSATTSTGPSILSDDGTTATVHGAVAVNDGSGNGGIVDLTEGTVSTAATAGHDLLYADSTSHCIKYSPNGASYACLGSGGGGITGSGTTGYIPKFSGSTAVGNSAIDDGITTAGVMTSTEPMAVIMPGSTSASVPEFSAFQPALGANQKVTQSFGKSLSAHNSLFNVWYNTATPFGSFETYALGDPIQIGASQVWLNGGTVFVGNSNATGGATLPSSTCSGGISIGTADQTCFNSSGVGKLATGTTAVTQSVGDNTTKLATDAFVLANAGGSSFITSLTTTGTSGPATVSSGVLNVPQYSGGGGGGGLFGPILGGTVPTQSGTGLTTHLNWRGSFSATDNSTGITIVDTAAAGSTESTEGVVKTYPGSTFTLTTLISLPPRATPGTLQPGLAILTTTGGKMITFGAQMAVGNAWSPIVNAYNSVSSFNSTLASGFPSSTATFTWLRIVDDGTNVSFSYSNDGQYFSTLYTVSKASSFLGSGGFGLIGFVLNPYNSAGGTTLMYWNGA